MTQLRGVTWDHVRGWGGLRAAARDHEAATGVRVTWVERSLQAFADQPVEELREFDLIVLDHPSIGSAVARGDLVPLDAHLDDAVMREQAAGSVGRSFESYTWEGRQWALAVDAAAQVAAVRPDLLRDLGVDIPTTWDGWLALATAARRHGRWIAMPAIPVDAICAFLAVCVAFGSEPFTAGTIVAGDAGRAALRTLRAVVEAAHPASRTWNPPAMLRHMSEHDDVVGCPLAFGYVNHATPGFAAHTLRFAPGPAGGDRVPRGTLGGAGLAVSSSSRAPEAAAAFAAFAASPSVQRTVYVSAGGQPGHRDAWTDTAVNRATGSFFADTLPALDAAYLRPRDAGFLDFQDRAGELVHRYLCDGGEEDAVVRALVSAAHEHLPTGVDR